MFLLSATMQPQQQAHVIIVQTSPATRQNCGKYDAWFDSTSSTILGSVVICLGLLAELGATLEIFYFVWNEVYGVSGATYTYYAGLWCGLIVRISAIIFDTTRRWLSYEDIAFC